MGSRLYQNLVASYESREVALKHFLQAYLASVASVDELIGEIIDVVDHSSLADNTVIVVTNDHGWGMGEKDYLYKNSLWQESTRVPLIIRAPGIGQPGGVVDHPVALIDLYPTLIDICNLTGDTMKNPNGHSLDGHSLKPFLENPATDQWQGSDEALTTLYRWRKKYDPSAENYSLRTADWRYIRYENGTEEFYHNARDPHEWTNLADDSAHQSRLISFRQQLASRIPQPGSTPPPQPAFKPKKSSARSTQLRSKT
jgi:arylsulfatase A-like enzyme